MSKIEDYFKNEGRQLFEWEKPIVEAFKQKYSARLGKDNMTDNKSLSGSITKQQAQEIVNVLEMQYLKETQALTITHMKLEYYKRLLSNFEKLEEE